MTTANGFAITIEVPSGDLNDARRITKTGWSGTGIDFPRPAFENIKGQYDELQRPGVYVLWDQDPELPTVYVGQSETPSGRIGHHARGANAKEFWTRAVVFSGGLNGAHARYIEASLVELAKSANRCNRDNSETPQKPDLNPADKMVAEGFLTNMLECLPVIGIRFFHQPPGLPGVRPTPGAVQPPGSPDEPYSTGAVRLALRNRNGADAEGYNGSEFVVLAGSKASKTESASIARAPRAAEQRQYLLQSGVLEDDGETLVFTQNYAFSSSSRAASVCLGRNASGNAGWKDHAGVPLGELV